MMHVQNIYENYMYVRMHVCMYVCMCMHVFVYENKCNMKLVFLYVCIKVSMYVCLYTNMNVSRNDNEYYHTFTAASCN